MEFHIEICVMLVTKNRKHYMTDGNELPNEEKIKTLGEKNTYKYLGILETYIIKQVGMKEKEECLKIILKKPRQRNKYLDCALR